VKHTLAVLCLTAACAAHGQAAPSLTGSWLAEWMAPNGRPVSAVLELTEGSGTWRQRVLGRVEDPCIKVAAPAKVVAQEDQPHLAITRSAVVGGCNDSRVKLTVGADGSLQGHWPDGRELRFTKQ
jgi:hypothetical protein